MRLIAYIPILALAATQGMGIPHDVFFFFFDSTVSVKSCSPSDKSIRCHGEWENTEECINELGTSRMCYCFHEQKDMAVANNHFAQFRACCQKKFGGSIEC